MRTLVTMLALAAAAWGQRHPAGDIVAEKPEGALLMQAINETDAARKAALLDQFCEKYPKADNVAWALETLQGLYVKGGQSEKIIATGEKLLAIDKEDPESALQNLKAAEALKDLPGIRKWGALASANARKMASAPQPSDAAAVESWKADVSYAQQVDVYTEYALFRVAVESRDPKATIEFGEALEAQNPKSQYLAQTTGSLFNAYRQSGANEKAVALAERVLATDQSNEDMLMVVADNYAAQHKNPEKVHTYTEKTVQVLAQKPAPAGLSESDWSKRKDQLTGLAHYLDGKLYYTEKKYVEADRELRGALPLAETNPAMKPEVLFMLGDANYNLKKAQDAADYFKACAALPGPMQATAAKNLQGIKSQYTNIK